MDRKEFEMVHQVMVNGGYTGDNCASNVLTTIGADVIIVKQRDLK